MAAAERKSDFSEPNEKMLDSEMEESDENQPLFEVETIIGKSKFKGQLMYKVRWKGYGQDDDTWEPVENLSTCQDLIEEYNMKLCEINRKRAEQRKQKRLEMEGRLSTDSSDSSAESTSVYPATFKNTFWKELEAGRVNVFETDMYSSVKRRAVEQTMKQEQKAPETPAPTSIPSTPNSASKTRNSTRSSKRSSQSVKRDRSDSSSRSSSKSNCSNVQKSASKPQRKSSPSKKASANTKLDFRNVIVTTDSETDNESKHGDGKKMDISDHEGDIELTKPSLSLVIKKVPQGPENSEQSCSFILQSTAQNLTEEHTKEDIPGPSQVETKPSEESAKKDEAEHRKSGSKKKKKKKHKDNRSGRRKEVAVDVESAKKRKVASTSLSSLPSESTLRCDRKILKLECNNQLVDKSKVEKHCLQNQTDSVTELAGKNVIGDKTATETNDLNQPVATSVSSSLFSEQSSTTKSIDHQKADTSNKSNVAVTTNSPSASSSSSHDLSRQVTDRSQCKLKDSGTNSMDSISSFSTGVLEPQVPLFGDVLRNMSTGKCEFERQDSETVDSGIASPASERSEQSGSRKVSNPALDDLFGRTVLPLLSDCEKQHSRDAEQLEIDLDDVDWNLFDIDVKLEPVSLSNNDFASAVVGGDSELVKSALLGNVKYDLERPDLSGKTLLMHAVNKMYDDIADLLINQGANIDAQMSTGYTPLMIACEHAEVATVNLLLELGAKVNLQCRNGESALMKAAKRGHSQIVWLLLECGANFNMVSNSGYTALSFVKLLRYEDTTSIIINHTQRVMSEFDKQVSMTLNNSAKILSTLFSPQVYNLCEGQRFQMAFKHSLQPPNPGVGYLLFIGHALFTSEEIKVRLYGACAVQEANLNGYTLSSLTKESTNFVLAFNPLVDGRNVLTINTVKAPDVKAKLIVCAYKAQLVQT